MVVSYIQSKGGYSSGAEQYTTDVNTHTRKIKTKLPKPFVRLYICSLTLITNTLLMVVPPSPVVAT